MAAQLEESVRSHTFFDSPEGSDSSPVRVNRRRRSAAVDGDDDEAETIHTSGYRDAQQAGSPFGVTSPIRHNRKRSADQLLISDLSTGTQPNACCDGLSGMTLARVSL